MKIIATIGLCFLLSTAAFSQTAQELNYQGIEFAKNGKFDEAFKIFEKAINLYPDASGPYTNRGNIYRMRKSYDLAIADYSKSIELSPDNLDVNYARANAYLDARNFEMAILDYSTIIERNPSFKDIFFDRAYAYIMLENFEGAKADLESQLEITPSDFKSQANLINIKKKLELYDEAILDYDKLIREFPNQPDLHIVYNNRADLYSKIGNHVLALQDVNKAIEINNEYDLGFLNRASIQLNLGNEKEACKDFKKAIKLGVENNKHFKIDDDYEKLKKLCQ
ncbi:tetratricopeptide repeat protein [Belliella pelovolcani]|uniref:Tetratricopeptide repeat-containing protein n=1 Tax=Belliella pelovolcani TaxID=529505 RepID=A0A1N7KV64_9BACT|nr:tetratricopeptide repeat protein [Belliella pelovolcani]SIS65431.1 Tetratricopeptide repeat-containing protein [Belliella pelovolcani]